MTKLYLWKLPNWSSSPCSCISGTACLISCEISLFVMAANREGILVTTYEFGVAFNGFSKVLLDCSRSPCHSANFEAHSLQNDFVVVFCPGVEGENRQALFYSLEAFTSKIQGNTMNTFLVDHNFCQIV